MRHRSIRLAGVPKRSRDKRDISVTLRLPTGLLKRIEKLADEKERTRNDVLNLLLVMALDCVERRPHNFP